MKNRDELAMSEGNNNSIHSHQQHMFSDVLVQKSDNEVMN